MNLKEIKEIISLMQEHGLTEIEIDREGAKIKIKKSPNGVYEPVVQDMTTPQAPPPSTNKGPSPAAVQETSGKAKKEIPSPMVGTFYRCPSPEAPPFVDIGQIIEVGQVVCIVEAMKLMNEIKSEVRGKVVETPVENAEPVEFGQTLFVIEAV